MSIEQHIQLSRSQVLVAPDKFDNHMRKARIDDIMARRSTFCQLSENGIEKQKNRESIKSSVY